ncbi:NAD-dependent epimerase/dehydratase family protein [Aquamicrobium sp. LC103]|uniref:NAD-dependent epimerase/dehydratase family protein n=1 Tax=Aquamicrobium sp. LC103 TaxID=1120658 RepID=UPI001FEFCD79|nr:NAD-dependent epimerase/dehydratase family protein [Aquamicrobium sp. LC103]
MRIFVTGAAGFVGSAIVEELIGAGHRVVGLARSVATASALLAGGAEPLRGDLDDPEILHADAAGADGVIHTAFNHDFSNSRQAAKWMAGNRNVGSRTRRLGPPADRHFRHRHPAAGRGGRPARILSRPRPEQHWLGSEADT